MHRVMLQIVACALSVSCCLGVFSGCTSPLNMRVVDIVTGEESVVLQREWSSIAPPPDNRYDNPLDRTFAAVIANAYPPIEPSPLAAGAIEGIADEAQRDASVRISPDQRARWSALACRQRTFDPILREVQALSPTTLSRDDMITAAVDGMVTAAPPNCLWLLPAKEADAFKQAITNRSVGEPGYLGIRLDNWPKVGVLPFSPAAIAGVEDGDIVLEVDGQRVPPQGQSLQEAKKLLAGSATAELSLVIKRGAEERSLRVRRESLAAVGVKAERFEGNILYIRIPSFEGGGVADKVRRMIQAADLPSGSVVLIDLRDNRGGRPEEANGVADVFLGEVVLQVFKFRDGHVIRCWGRPGALDGVRVLALTNLSTGSAAEMLVMALRDHECATVIGERTAGMLLGKDICDLPDGACLVYLTDPLILSPKGTDYSTRGIPPDINVEDNRLHGKDAVLERALQEARNSPAVER